MWKVDLPSHDCGIKIVGTPIGHVDYIVSVGVQKLGEEAQLISSLLKLPSIQIAWLLLYFCVVPKINHFLRTLCPCDVEIIADKHDERLFTIFRCIFNIPCEESWNDRFHLIDFSSCAYQSKMPLRFGGCGLRDSNRIAPAAYWASFADVIPIIHERFPVIGDKIFSYLSNPDGSRPIRCLDHAEKAGRCLDQFGWSIRPTWQEIKDGVRPLDISDMPACPGEFAHGWQFLATRSLDSYSFDVLLTRFGLPSTRRNAKSHNKTRLYSVRGPQAASWMLFCPVSSNFEIENDIFRCCMKYRLGVAINFEGPDCHGHF